MSTLTAVLRSAWPLLARRSGRTTPPAASPQKIAPGSLPHPVPSPAPAPPSPSASGVRSQPPNPTQPASNRDADPQAEAEQAVSELRAAARAAGIVRGDAQMPLLSAFARAILFIGKRSAETDQAFADATQRVNEALALARTTADAEHDRFQTSLDATKAYVIQSIAGAIARSADTALTRRVRRFDYGTLGLSLLGMAAIAIASAAVGYRQGHADALAGVRQTEAGLRAAFTESAAEAETWLNLMTWNAGHAGLERCTPPITFLDGGRKACNVLLWIEAPRPTTPP